MNKPYNGFWTTTSETDYVDTTIYTTTEDNEVIVFTKDGKNVLLMETYIEAVDADLEVVIYTDSYDAENVGHTNRESYVAHIPAGVGLGLSLGRLKVGAIKILALTGATIRVQGMWE